MFFKSNFFRVASALCLALTLTVFAFGDTIRLKDGSIIKGKIVSFGSGKFVIVVGSGTNQRQLNYSANEVESIAFDGGAMPTMSNNNSSKDSNSTIITVGQTKPQTPTANIETSPKVVTTLPTAPPKVITTSPSNPTAMPKPIEVGVKVLADNTSNGWTNSGWVVKKGQKIKITGTGRVSLGGGYYTTPTGISSLADKEKLIPEKATGGLIAVIGEDNNNFIFVGNSYEFTATRDGTLFLGVNEGNLNDNSGSFDIKIEISPEIGY